MPPGWSASYGDPSPSSARLRSCPRHLHSACTRHLHSRRAQYWPCWRDSLECQLLWGSIVGESKLSLNQPTLQSCAYHSSSCNCLPPVARVPLPLLQFLATLYMRDCHLRYVVPPVQLLRDISLYVASKKTLLVALRHLPTGSAKFLRPVFSPLLQPWRHSVHSPRAAGG